MPRLINEYRIFIGSPGGLEAERKAFKKVVSDYCGSDAQPRGVLFHPVGWEDTLPGPGRPQEVILSDLRSCDYAIFLFHDRWGRPTGKFSSGTEEEWLEANKLFEATKLHKIIIFFKRVNKRQLNDPGEQLAPVLAFRKRVESERKHLFKEFANTAEFCDELRKQLGDWLFNHERQSKATNDPAQTIELAAPPSINTGNAKPATEFEFWFAEAKRLEEAALGASRNNSGILFCAERALDLSTNDAQWGNAKNCIGVAKYFSGDLTSAFEQFSDVADRLISSGAIEERALGVKALVNKAVILTSLGRTEDAIAAYDDVITSYGGATEVLLREQVARALTNKGVALIDLKRYEDAIAVHNDVISRFATAAEPGFRELVAKALLGKGFVSDQIQRYEDAVAAYDDLVARFGAETNLSLQEEMAKALVNKGLTLGTLGRSKDEIAAYDDVVARFGGATDVALREQVARALFNKGVTVGALGRIEDAIAAYDDLTARFSAATELALHEQVANALLNKGGLLGALGRIEDATAAYDDLIARFGTAMEPGLQALINMARDMRTALIKKNGARKKNR